jgi:hypothetical protein
MKAPIPTLMTGNADVDQFAGAVKQNLDTLSGQHKNAVKLKALPSTATLAQVITQLNAILVRIQG